MNKTIFKYTIMSACLDPMKLIYVALLGFVVPIGMKVASLMHGAADSQTFEMLTGKVGVAFILMVLCLGLAGNTSTQGGRGGEYLPLIFTRPLTRTQYVITKWLAVAAIGGILATLQNLIVAFAGSFFGEVVSTQALLSTILERFLDAALIGAAMLLVMLNKHPYFQIAAILSFYIWMTGQTLPPVSVAGASPGTDELSLQATRILLGSSQVVSEFILPTINVYDLLNTHQFWLAPVATYLSMVALYLVLSIAVTNRREFFYGTN
jgi:hypothetical protein